MVLTSIGLGSDNGKRFKVSAVGLLRVVPKPAKANGIAAGSARVTLKTRFTALKLW